MDILLINANPMVSNLIALSTRDEMYRLDEISDAMKVDTSGYDIVFVDDEIYTETVEAFVQGLDVKRKVFLSSGEQKSVMGFDKVIRKPFLPSQILEVLEAPDEVATHDTIAGNVDQDLVVVAQREEDLPSLEDKSGNLSIDDTPQVSLNQTSEDYLSLGEATQAVEPIDDDALSLSDMPALSEAIQLSKTEELDTPLEEEEGHIDIGALIDEEMAAVAQEETERRKERFVEREETDKEEEEHLPSDSETVEPAPLEIEDIALASDETHSFDEEYTTIREADEVHLDAQRDHEVTDLSGESKEELASQSPEVVESDDEALLTGEALTIDEIALDDDVHQEKSVEDLDMTRLLEAIEETNERDDIALSVTQSTDEVQEVPTASIEARISIDEAEEEETIEEERMNQEKHENKKETPAYPTDESMEEKVEDSVDETPQGSLEDGDEREVESTDTTLEVEEAREEASKEEVEEVSLVVEVTREEPEPTPYQSTEITSEEMHDTIEAIIEASPMAPSATEEQSDEESEGKDREVRESALQGSEPVLDPNEIDKIKSLLEEEEQRKGNVSEQEVDEKRTIEKIKKDLISEGLEIVNEEVLWEAIGVEEKPKRSKKIKKKKKLRLEELERLEMMFAYTIRHSKPKKLRKLLKGKKVKLKLKDID